MSLSILIASNSNPSDSGSVFGGVLSQPIGRRLTIMLLMFVLHHLDADVLAAYFSLSLEHLYLSIFFQTPSAHCLLGHSFSNSVLVHRGV